MFDQEIYMKPHEDIQKLGFIWKLKNPLYELDDKSRRFWLKVKEFFLELGLKMMPKHWHVNRWTYKQNII